jgi:hypothetical protein
LGLLTLLASIISCAQWSCVPMLEKCLKVLHQRVLHHAQPMIEPTKAVGDSVVYNALRLKRLIVEVLKAVAKCWAFFKDVHFSWYVIIPVMSSLSPFGEVSALLLWVLLFLPLLVVITFRTLDSIFDLSGSDAGASQPAGRADALTGSLPIRAAGSREGSAGHAPLQSHTITVSPRAHHPRSSRTPAMG